MGHSKAKQTTQEGSQRYGHVPIIMLQVSSQVVANPLRTSSVWHDSQKLCDLSIAYGRGVIATEAGLDHPLVSGNQLELEVAVCRHLLVLTK